MSLDAAVRHRAALDAAWAAALDDPRFDLFWSEYPNAAPALPDSEWNRLAFVSVSGTEVHGFLDASVDRSSDSIDQLTAMNFREGSPVFARDLWTFFGRLLRGGWGRIGWNVKIGNPAEAMYDRVVERLGGRVVGVQRRFSRARSDRRWLDAKWYEILPDEVPKSTMDSLVAGRLPDRADGDIVVDDPATLDEIDPETRQRFESAWCHTTSIHGREGL